LDLVEFKRMHEELEEVKAAVLQEEDSQVRTCETVT
jgi:hypothetical protein